MYAYVLYQDGLLTITFSQIAVLEVTTASHPGTARDCECINNSQAPSERACRKYGASSHNVKGGEQ